MNLQEVQVALQSSDEEIRRAVLGSLKDIPFSDAQSVLFTAMADESWRVRKEAVERYVSLSPDLNSIEQLLNLLRNEENAGLRNSASEAVIRLGSAASSPLLKMVQDQDNDVRKFIIDVMGAIGDQSFLPALISALDDADVNVAAAAAEQIGILGDSNAAEQLVAAIVKRGEVLFRFSALNALVALNRTVAVPDALIKLADQDILRKAVFECLGSISDISSLKLLLNGFSSTQKNSRAAAVKSLYKIYRRSTSDSQLIIREALQLLKENEIITGLINLNHYSDPILTESLIWVSVIIKDTRFIPLLIEVYADERFTEVAFSSLKLFGREALYEITSRYSALDEAGRSALCNLIAECGYSGFNDFIQKALAEQSPNVRKAAALAVGKLGLITSIPDLIKLIDDPDPHVYMAAVSSLQSLVMISRSVMVLEVDRFRTSKELHHRKAAVLLLASLGEIDSLLLLIKDEEPQVRKTAVTALGANRVEKSGSMLVLALTDEDPDVRIAVAEALGTLKDTSTLDAMEQALGDDDIWVQSALLKAIANIDPSRVLSIIKNSHKKISGLPMITSLQILEEIGGETAEAIIRYAIQSEDLDIVRQATKSLDRLTTRKN
ncbi:MAG: HEAT repeat domain-containing protein [Desulfuromonadaceae bacterium]|nr:HEAT repeat domain-containing protein [Desulfuromonadaceae bacterium]MDD2856628.1 HEAT repeat domain-containing protein [Desulfuromonadaceae bacterium]